MPISSDIIALLANQGNPQAAGALRQGDIAAQEAARKQALWASIIGTGINVATNLPGQIAQMREQKALADERNAKVQAAQRAQALDDRANGILNTLMTPEGRVDRNKLRSAFAHGQIPIDIQDKFLGSLDKVDAANDKYEAARTDAQADIANEILTGIDAGGDPDAMIALGLAHAKAKPGLMTPDEQKQIGQQLSESDNPKAVLMGIRARSEKYKKETQPVVLPRPGAQLVNPATGAIVAESPLPATKPVAVAPGASLVNPDTGTPVFSAPEKPEAKQSKSVLLDGKPSEVVFEPRSGKYFNAAGEDVSARVKPLPPASVIYPNPQGEQAVRDVKETIAGMKDGTIPPVLPGRATREYDALLAEAHRQGFNLAQAALDWTATQKHIATLNNGQQTRLMQSINQLPDLLDSVDELAKQWKGGKFPLLNKVNLAAAKNGAYGEEAASIARKLDAQIADVTADLGNVYMGGNTPTDHALELAGKALSGDWSEKVLHDMIGMARKNVQIRRNSVKNTGVAGASENNPYAPKVEPPSGGDADLVKRLNERRKSGG